jgi:predicted nicotinamide N-methyase
MHRAHVTPRRPPAVATTGSDELRRTLERQFTTASDTLVVGDWEVELLRPRNADDLISEADFVRDDRLPYWADLWPSARVLAAALTESRMPPDGPPPRLLELGCGLGLVSIAALRAGYEVMATDYYGDALRFTAANAWRAVGRPPATRLVDWRHFPHDMGTFDRVVAADVLYEHAYGPLIAQAIAETLAPTGVAIIADPGRIAAPAFLEGLSAHGLELSGTDVRPFEEPPIRQQISLHSIVQRARPS